MASRYQESFEWHEGEKQMHTLLHVPEQENPSTPGLSPYGFHLIMISPLLAWGTLDHLGRPWTTLLGGEPGFSKPVGRSIIGVKTVVDRDFDPVLKRLLGDKKDGEVFEPDGDGRVVSGLSIDLLTRSRVKLSGKMVAGALGDTGAEGVKEDDRVGEVQLVIKIERSLGERLRLRQFNLRHDTHSSDRQLSKVSQQEADHAGFAQTHADFRLVALTRGSGETYIQGRYILHLLVPPWVKHEYQ